jgi:hypothetical protein
MILCAFCLLEVRLRVQLRVLRRTRPRAGDVGARDSLRYTPTHVPFWAVCRSHVARRTFATMASSSSNNNDIASHLRVGITRVRDQDGFVGTVMYVGPVPSAKNATEIYAGIAWDDNSRGKHDGSVISRQTNQLVRLFHAKQNNGSFLRLSKLDLGVSLTTELMKSKYVEMDAPVVAPNNVLPHSAQTAGGREKPIEFLGELQIRKRQQLVDLEKISLRSLGIATVTPDGMTEFQHLREIDLAGNLLCDWETVFQILHQFPLLEYLSLASNRIRDIPPSLMMTESRPACLQNMRVLNLNGCSIQSFETIQWIADAMPQLEELCVAYNDLSSVGGEEKSAAAWLSTPCLFGLLLVPLDFLEAASGTMLWSTTSLATPHAQ